MLDIKTIDNFLNGEIPNYCFKHGNYTYYLERKENIYLSIFLHRKQEVEMTGNIEDCIRLINKFQTQ